MRDFYVSGSEQVYVIMASASVAVALSHYRGGGVCVLSVNGVMADWESGDMDTAVFIHLRHTTSQAPATTVPKYLLLMCSSFLQIRA